MIDRWGIGRLLTLNSDGYPGLGAWWIQIRSGLNNENIVARVYGDNKDEIYKNASLIAAAPEMLQALEKFALVLSGEDKGFEQDVIDSMNAAILKANNPPATI